MILGVEKVMSLFAAGSTQELIIESLDIRVFMGHTHGLAFIFAVKTFHAFVQKSGIAVEEGLTAAVDTTAGTCHDFDCLEAIFVSSDHVENFAGITQTGANGNINGFAGSDFNFGFFDAVKTADSAEIDCIAFEVFAVEHVVN